MDEERIFSHGSALPPANLKYFFHQSAKKLAGLSEYEANGFIYVQCISVRGAIEERRKGWQQAGYPMEKGL